MARMSVVLLAVLLAACGGGGNDKQIKLEGERIAVLTFEQELVPDPQLVDVQVAIPRPYLNRSWPQAGGSTTHALHHLELGEQLSQAWRVEVGSGSEKYERLVSGPVVADGTIYTVDIRARVTAVDADSGRQLWSVRLDKEGEKKSVAFGGGVAYWNGRVYVTTGYGFVAALDAGSGRELWRYDTTITIRGAPTVDAGRVFVLTHDNQIVALSADDGSLIWDQVGIAENAGILGAASPAVSGDTVVAALSSGELFALRVENGRITWQDALTRTRRLTPLATLSDIDGHPVIDRGRVYAYSHAGRMVAIDMRSGERVWEVNIGGLSTPWIAGDYIFLVTVDGEVACVSRRDGRVRWVTQLQRYENQEKRRGVISWTGPVLAGDRLVVASSHGFLLSLSPYTGQVLSGKEMPDGTLLPPVIADRTLYVMTDAGDLIAYR